MIMGCMTGKQMGMEQEHASSTITTIDRNKLS